VAKAIYEEAAARSNVDMPEATEILRELHKTAPFLFLNGNTFAQVGKTSLLVAIPGHSRQLRSLVGHHISGNEILTKEELAKAFRDDETKDGERLSASGKRTRCRAGVFVLGRGGWRSLRAMRSGVRRL
jgi:hypothetical protein